MKVLKVSLFSLALVVVPAASARPQSAAEGNTLELAAVRFYRASSGQTVVDAFCQVPFTLLDRLPRSPAGGAAAGGGGGGAAYRFAVTVKDTAGLELLSQSWTQTVATRPLSVARGSAVEHFSFAAKPGRYTIEVAVTDSATGRVTRQRADVAAFSSNPGASDLLLATSMREAGPAESPGPGEIRKGSLTLQAAGRPVLTPQQARLGYYLELYAGRPETLTVAVRVKAAQGAQLVATPGERIPLPAGGGVTRGMVDLAGLPPGDYRLEVAASGGRDTVVRGAAFRMAGFETEAAIAEASPVRDVFGSVTEAQLDTLYLPLVYLMTSAEQGIYPALTLEGKRSWIRQFWQKRDPTPGTPRNELQEDFYTRIADANRRFREGGAAQIPGWRTDRGRIFIKYGVPDEVLSRPQAGNTRPFEVWKYTRNRALKYVFLDQTLFGNYALIWTDDRREPSRPNWQEMLGPEAVIEVERF
jgi:GWxTD domain-containing protein